jgi:hypothetical protein
VYIWSFSRKGSVALPKLGLDLDDRCLRHHEEDPTEKFFGPPTISYLKASRPVSMSAIGRAKAFGALLDPIRVGLSAGCSKSVRRCS